MSDKSAFENSRLWKWASTVIFIVCVGLALTLPYGAMLARSLCAFVLFILWIRSL